MRGVPYLPVDELTGEAINFDLAADWLELSAFFADDANVSTAVLANQIALGASEDYASLDDETQHGEEEIRSSTVARIEDRQHVLGVAYPFELDQYGNRLKCVLSENVGQAAYVLSLLLSNLASVSPILVSSRFYPSEEEIRKLRGFFQYFATAALAAELHGCAWSFGFPRPDSSGFLDKLERIWRVLGDGQVGRQHWAPRSPKDDQIDVFAARPHSDRLPGFPLAVAQVATGKNADAKSLKGHLDAFRHRWFTSEPATTWVPYIIVPFARTRDQFIDNVWSMGNVLHRLRVPRRVAEAGQLVEDGVMIEGYDQLEEAAQWLAVYRGRARCAA